MDIETYYYNLCHYKKTDAYDILKQTLLKVSRQTEEEKENTFEELAKEFDPLLPLPETPVITPTPPSVPVQHKIHMYDDRAKASNPMETNRLRRRTRIALPIRRLGR